MGTEAPRSDSIKERDFVVTLLCFFLFLSRLLTHAHTQTQITHITHIQLYVCSLLSVSLTVCAHSRHCNRLFSLLTVSSLGCRMTTWPMTLPWATSECAYTHARTHTHTHTHTRTFSSFLFPCLSLHRHSHTPFPSLLLTHPATYPILPVLDSNVPL